MQKLLESYDQKALAEVLRRVGQHDWSRETLNRWLNGKEPQRPLSDVEIAMLNEMLPDRQYTIPTTSSRFIDLFAGIGGIRKGFEAIGGQCVFTSEWNREAVRTYKANWYCDPGQHRFNGDIREVTLTENPDINIEEAYENIRKEIPEHDVLLAGFPVSLSPLPVFPRRIR